MIDRQDIEFKSGGVTCRAWLFQAHNELAPCVVLGHGFGGTRECGLLPYTRRFAEAGYHSLVFDYRYFGDSDGEPRQLLDIGRQLEDWSAAIETARQLDKVDPDRVVAWGTSFGAGHVLMVGVQDGHLAGIICQCPMMDGRAAFLRMIHYAGFRPTVTMFGHVLFDVGRALLNRSPHCVPIVGDPGDIAMMSTPDARPGYEALALPHVRSDVAARVALSIPFYRPVKMASRLRTPMLLLVCNQDSVAPVGPALEVKRRGGGYVDLVRFDISHFDIYQGEHFERAVGEMLSFLRRVAPTR